MKRDKPVKVCFLYAEKNREFHLADAFLMGVKLAGDDPSKVSKGQFKGELSADVYCMVGVKSLKIFKQIRDAGKQVLFFDKGYFRHRGPNRVWEYWRIAVNDHHPTDYVASARHGIERWKTTSRMRGIYPKPWRETGAHIVYAGSSEKYHAFVGLPDPTTYARSVIEQIKERSDRRIIYRPKPTWLEAVPIEGSDFSSGEQNIYQVLQNAWCLVTNGSNAAFDAVMEGIPSIVLGRSIGLPISSTDLNDLDDPRLASDAERNQWLANLAWCQFTEQEMLDGLAWKAVRPQLFDEELDDTQLDAVASQATKPSKAALKKIGRWGKKPQGTKEEKRARKGFSKVKVAEAPDEVW